MSTTVLSSGWTRTLDRVALTRFASHSSLLRQAPPSLHPVSSRVAPRVGQLTGAPLQPGAPALAAVAGRSLALREDFHICLEIPDITLTRYLVTHGYSYVHLCKTEHMHANACTKVEMLESFKRFLSVIFNL